jgi:hypothetical protein
LILYFLNGCAPALLISKMANPLGIITFPVDDNREEEGSD